MIPQNYKDIVDKLSERTSQGGVSWNAVSSSCFAVSVSEFSLSVSLSFDEDEDLHYVCFALRNEKGEQLDSFWVGQREGGYAQARKLYDMARRKALRIDEAIMHISAYLDTAEHVGVPDSDVAAGG